ncbi:MAG: putative metal-binding motif-containing protein [Myxococcota bacterium]|nr:putative metal-binding motif-containing protein [Myxococcota bacterium]
MYRKSLVSLIACLALCACEDVKFEDLDEDGVASGLDCNDDNASIFPGAEETCDGIDNNCDGEIDEIGSTGGTIWYIDFDGDGYGSDGYTVIACDTPSGYVDNTEDCNDGEATAYPGADESCDGVDNDCDEEIDEDDAIDMSVWYADADGDGYGNEDDTTEACDAPSGYTDDATDCNDENDGAYPDATEYCDGVDNDCDEEIDEDDAVDMSVWYYDGDGDGYGRDSIVEEACDAPSDYVDNDEDCDDSDEHQYPGADEYCNDEDDDCDGDTDEDGEVVDGETYWADMDEDSFGDPDDTLIACEQPGSYIDNDYDCDDLVDAEPVAVDAEEGSSSGDGSYFSPLDSIQDAIRLSIKCVVVFEGTYEEIIDFEGFDIEVTGVDGPDDTVIDGSSYTGPVVTFETRETSDAVLEGFTLRGGTGHLEESNETYACTSVTTCLEYYETWCGGAIYVDGADPTLRDLIVEENELTEASVTEDGNDTYYVYSYGGGICMLDSQSTLEAVDFFANDADQGGGMYIDEYSNISLSESWIVGNTATDGGGIQVEGGSLVMTNVASVWNEAEDDGGGALVVDGDLVENFVTHGADDAANGGGIYLSGSGYGEIMNTIVWGAATGEGILGDSSATFDGTYNNVYDNAGGEYSGVDDPTGDDGNISEDPEFNDVTDDEDASNDDWTLSEESPSYDAGTTDEGDVSGNAATQQGAFGGDDGDWDEGE